MKRTHVLMFTIAGIAFVVASSFLTVTLSTDKRKSIKTDINQVSIENNTGINDERFIVEDIRSLHTATLLVNNFNKKYRLEKLKQQRNRIFSCLLPMT